MKQSPEKTPAEPPEWYFTDALDYYGTCRASPCICLKPKHPWIGRLCPNWTPIGFKSHAEMMAHAGRIYGERDADA